MNKNERIAEIEKYGMLAKGKKELINYLEGKTNTQQQAIWAKCYDCMGYYADGKEICTVEGCSLRPFMPYNPNRIKKTKVMSEEQKKASAEILRNARKCRGA